MCGTSPAATRTRRHYVPNPEWAHEDEVAELRIDEPVPDSWEERPGADPVWDEPGGYENTTPYVPNPAWANEDGEEQSDEDVPESWEERDT
jgi:hypothetical protein